MERDSLDSVDRRLTPWLVALLIVMFSAGYLLWVGRVAICTCGHVKLWHGVTMSSENSQHIADWYTPSHIIHGLLFYWALWLAAGRMPLGWRLALATAVECAWEVIENSDTVIERYRAVTISLDYYGDSVVNTLADILAMWLGFALARFLPVWASVLLALLFEILTGIIIRDGLALNVLMLVWPLESVVQWQSGG